MKDLHKRGHLFMAIKSDAAATYWPDPSAEEVTDGPTGWGFSESQSDSPFASGDRTAIIYAVLCCNGPATLGVKDHGDTNTLFQVSAGASSIGTSYTFGPEGVRIEGGFSIATPTTSGEDDFLVVYDIVG